MVQAQNRLTDLENRQKTAQKELSQKMDDADSKTRASLEVIADKVGITQKDLSTKAGILQAEEAATQKRLKADEQATKDRFTAVNGAVEGVKGQVNKVSADISDTRTDLAATKGRLETAIGDINRHSELIATNHDQLEQLKHRGDRDYVEFTLYKGQEPKRVASVSLQLKKVDPKKGQYTLYVLADDKKIEKKDRNLNEPLQFYTGRDRNLFEVVINAVDKNAVSGYMSTPKNMAAANVAPDPRAAQPR
jgi:chromosome segregation ATPase